MPNSMLMAGFTSSKQMRISDTADRLFGHTKKIERQNMKLEFHSKSLNYNLDGSLKGTVVTLGHMDGGHLPVVLDGDQTALSNQELFELAMEEHYQENFPNRAENEKFNLLGEKIAKYDDLIEKSQTAIKDLEGATAEAKEATIKNEESVNNAVSELTELIMSILGQSQTNILVEETE